MIMNKEHVKMTQLHIHKPNKFSDNSFVSTSKQEPRNHSCIVPDFHRLNSIQTSQEKSILETATLTRTYTFDRQRMDKSDSGKEHENNSPERYHDEQSTLLRLVKKRTGIVKSEYYLTNDEIKTNEPTLLQVKYFDGRPTLTNFDALESMEKSKLLRSSRLNFSKTSITQDLSYGKRILNRVQTFIKPPSNDQTKPWQQKTLFGIFNEIKNKK